MGVAKNPLLPLLRIAIDQMRCSRDLERIMPEAQYLMELERKYEYRIEAEWTVSMSKN
jgi:hypothetical protein